MIKKCYARVMERIKEIPQDLATSVTSGKRNWSGKIDIELYYDLVKI